MRSSVALLASTASHPTFVTIAIRPSWQGGIARANHIFLKNGSKIFFAQGLDRLFKIRSDLPDRQPPRIEIAYRECQNATDLHHGRHCERARNDDGIDARGTTSA